MRKNGLLSELESTRSEIFDKCAICADGVVCPDHNWAALLALPNQYGVMRCRGCGLRWLSPRPSAAGYQALYSSEHYFHSPNLVDYSSFAAERIAKFQQRVSAAIKRFAGPVSILDYGSATGEFVALAKKIGAQAVGVEFSADARKEAFQLHKIALLTPEEANQLPGDFDAIHMNHVLEHMPDPRTHLDWCSKVLRPGGLLMIEVPNQFCNLADRLRRAFGKGGKQQQFDAFSLHHTYFFSPPTLALLCEKSGFRVLSLRTLVSANTGRLSWKRRILESILEISSWAFMSGDAIELYAEKLPSSPSPAIGGRDNT